MAKVYTRDTRLDTTKIAIASAVTNSAGDHEEARSWAIGRWGEAGTPSNVFKDAGAVAIPGLDASSTTGLNDREMFRAVREKALLFRMKGVRRTDFKMRSITTSNAIAAWVEEGKPIPVAKPDVTNVGLAPAKLAGLSVWTEEALQASPGIEALVFDDLVQAVAEGLDLAMFDPTNDGSGVPPAALTYGATAIAATSAIDNDLAEALAAFAGDLKAAYWVACPQVAAGLSLAFDTIGARGGDLAGIPVLTSNAAPDAQLTLIDPGSIMAAWDGIIDLQTSRHGTVEMSGTPTQDQPTGAAQVSMWQTNMVGIRAVGRFAWAAAGPAGAVSITGLFPDAS